MYIWTAINVNGQLSALRNEAEYLSNALDMGNGALTLPLHISLRISFFIEDRKYQPAFDSIENYLNTLSPFEIKTDKIEKHGNIIWLAMKSNGNLTDIHNCLTETMLRDFGIDIHPFDRMFLYHSTLFISDNDDKLNNAYSNIIKAGFPEKLKAGRFIIGNSETGKAGDFKVIKEIEIK